MESQIYNYSRLTDENTGTAMLGPDFARGEQSVTGFRSCQKATSFSGHSNPYTQHRPLNVAPAQTHLQEAYPWNGQALLQSSVEKQIQIGEHLTHGTGGNPEIGEPVTRSEKVW
ncbi:hypothetical protein MKW98_018006 [Papaver atlanticum]|uniref:Uncharacterized protein n=1 Tax=Papaver atlanticum TaxID=357466 RepID=A0AAD4TF20_9MAGN|nr:hypothetical protein MKW98_018006 [Papaver atlanticum]